MITCKKCNAQVADGSKFCYACGAEISAPQFCAQCGTQINDGSSYCKNCGTPVAGGTLSSGSQPEIVPDVMQNANQAPVPTPELNPVPTPESNPVQAAPIPAPIVAPTTYPVPAGESAPVPYQSQVPYPGPAPAPYPGQPNLYKNQNKKPGIKLPQILIAAGALVLIVVLAFTVPKVLSMFSKAPKGVVYLKDSEINYTSIDKIKSKEITDNLDEDGALEGSDSYSLSGFVAFSEDGKRMFYPDKVSDSDDGATIYYCSVGSKEPEGTKIDSDIISYAINKKGTKIYYLKGSDGDLYVSNLKDKDKIDNSVSEFYLDETGNNLVYITTDGTIYRKNGSKEKDKVDSNASLVYISKDLSKIFYIKDSTLYVKSGDKEKDKIASDVYDVVKAYDNGTVYYLESEDATLYLSDFVNDDLASSDATMVEPSEPYYPDYYAYEPSDSYPIMPDSWDYTDYWGYTDWDAYYDAYDEYSAEVDAYNQKWDDAYYAAVDQYDQDYAAYQTAYDEYYAKLNRDSLRESFASESVTLTQYSLYYYDGSETSKITDTYNTYDSYSENSPVMVYKNNIKGEYNKINMSEVMYYEDVYNLASESTSFTTEAYVAVNGKAVKLEDKNGSSFYLNDAGDKLYYLEYPEDSESVMDEESDTAQAADLYYADIKGSAVSSPVLYDKDVTNFCIICDNGDVSYIKDADGSSGDLYINKEKVDSDVNAYSLYQLPDTNSIIYDTDYNYDDYTYSLNIYNGKKGVEIASDVYTYTVIDGINIAYISDYDTDDYSGDLYLYDGSKKSKQIDEDVTSIIYIYDKYTYGGNSYYE